MKKVILIHGNGGGTGHDHWFPDVKKEIEKLGIACLAPDFPDSELARAKYWLPYLENELQADEDTILVGHSSGAVAAMRYAEAHKIFGSILVAAYYTDLGYEDEKKSGYFDRPWHWEDIKENQRWTVVFASNDDPYIPIEQPEFIASQLGAEPHKLPGRGHFGSDAPVFPELVDVIKDHMK
ncbi:MAG: alpha/beta fold hydrolase [Candidatus Berkelbacteria bacterium]|nr:alpha/beta fold hydrolase [Candidatus Berkelbacteria bacterium]